jgi:hypothetical protein
VSRQGRLLLTAVAIVIIAATPGAAESYLAWHEFPETRTWIVGWYVALVVMVLLAVHANIGIGG